MLRLVILSITQIKNSSMKRTQLTVKRRLDSWEISFSEIGMQEFTAEESKLLELISGNKNYAEILNHYALSTKTVFSHINALHKKLIVQKGKKTADHFLYTAMLKFTGLTYERTKLYTAVLASLYN